MAGLNYSKFSNLIVSTICALAGFVLPVSAELTVEQTWNEEFVEINGQIARLKGENSNWRNRLKAEALDTQALVLSEDADPLDVVLRRTAALLRYYEVRQMLSSPRLSKFEKQLSKLTASARTASRRNVRKALFTKACWLRRKIAFSNPLLDFDHIVCMLEQPGDRRIIEQARACFPGHSKGGGPIIISNFKSQRTVEKPMAGVKVASGPWKGKELTGYFSGLELSYDASQLLL
ncbi:MAG: hypothetical protein ACYS8Z_25180, partial [Planctomycetota bacterium]